MENLIIKFEDENLKRAIIENEADINGDNEISIAEALQVKGLELWESNITSIQGIEYFKNLSYINLNDNKISDITPLKDLKKIRSLNFAGNQITDISILENLINLEWLHINNNPITDITAISSLTNIYELYIDNMTNLEPISKLINLEEIYIEGVNEISDIADIETFKSLDIQLSNFEYLNIGNFVEKTLNKKSLLKQLNIAEYGKKLKYYGDECSIKEALEYIAYDSDNFDKAKKDIRKNINNIIKYYIYDYTFNLIDSDEISENLLIQLNDICKEVNKQSLLKDIIIAINEVLDKSISIQGKEIVLEELIYPDDIDNETITIIEKLIEDYYKYNKEKYLKYGSENKELIKKYIIEDILINWYPEYRIGKMLDYLIPTFISNYEYDYDEIGEIEMNTFNEIIEIIRRCKLLISSSLKRDYPELTDVDILEIHNNLRAMVGQDELYSCDYDEEDEEDEED